MTRLHKAPRSIDALMRRIPLGFLILLGALFVIIAVLLVKAPPAAAQTETSWRTIRREFRLCDWDGCRTGYRYVRVRFYAAPRRDLDDERWERRAPSIERGAHCKDDIVRVVGGLHLTKDGALNDAVRQWQSTV